jgi:predicted Zn-dependent protease
MIRRLRALLLLPGILLATGCAQAVNPATGESQYTAMSPAEELEVGREEHPKILQQFGGTYSDSDLQAYVDRIGNKLKAVSELPDLDFTFTLLDSEIVNAFALPGGYVYISRGLLALADNEAEMAGVLAHEIGHVTARHSAQRYSRGVVAQGGLTASTILAGVFGGQAAADAVQQLGGKGAQAYLAGYSRDQEFQADELGVRYLARAGYDPRAMSSFLEKLGRNDQLGRKLAGKEGQDPAASWFATHPRTPDRVARAAAQAGGAAGDTQVGRDRYLGEIDGMIYGEDPSQGFTRGRRFIHPDLRFAFEAPPGFRLLNTPSAVIGRDQANRAMKFDLVGVAPGRDMSDYVAEDWGAELGAGRLRDVKAFDLEGLPGASAATSGTLEGGQEVDIGLAAIRAGEDRVYRFMFVNPGRMSSDEAKAYQATVNSFRVLSSQDAAQFKPRRIKVVQVRPGETESDLAARMAVDDLKTEQFVVLNGLRPGADLSPGQPVKLVVD